jgi:hypothetical protein
MKATEYLNLQDDYRIVLRLWSDTRALYPENSLEVIEMEKQLSAIEYLLEDSEPQLSGDNVHENHR